MCNIRLNICFTRIWDIFCLYLCYIRKCNMVGPTHKNMISCVCTFLHIKMCNLSISVLLFFRIWTAAYQNVPKGERVSFNWTSQRLGQSQMAFDNLMGYILSISMCTQNFITIFHSVQEIGSFSLFQNLELGKASTDEKWHLAVSWARSSQYKC